MGKSLIVELALDELEEQRQKLNERAKSPAVKAALQAVRAAVAEVEKLRDGADDADRGTVDAILGTVWAVEDAIKPEEPPFNPGPVELIRDQNSGRIAGAHAGDMTISFERNERGFMTRLSCHYGSGAPLQYAVARDHLGRVSRLVPESPPPTSPQYQTSAPQRQISQWRPSLPEQLQRPRR